MVAVRVTEISSAGKKVYFLYFLSLVMKLFLGSVLLIAQKRLLASGQNLLELLQLLHVQLSEMVVINSVAPYFG